MSIFSKFITVLFILSVAYADVTVTATKNNDTDKVGYLNATNTLTLLLAQTGADQDVTKIYKVMAFFSTTKPDDGESLPFNNNTWISLNDDPISLAMNSPNSSFQITFVVTNSHLTAANSAQNTNGKYVDFAIVRVDDASSPSEAEKTLILVNDIDGQLSVDALLLDNIYPDVSINTPSNNCCDRGFNTQSVKYYLNEQVVSTSFLRFDGDVNDNGSHKYMLPSNMLSAGSWHNTGDINFGSDGDLQENARYDLDFYLEDLAGNQTWRNNERYDIYFDQTVPTISSASTTASDNTYKKGDELSIKLTFDSPVYTTGTMRVTFETGDIDSYEDITSWGINNITQNKTFIYDVRTNDLTTDLTIKEVSMVSGNIKDRANNSLTVYSIPQNLSANHTLNIDGVFPMIQSITSSKDNGTYGIAETMTIVTTFSEAVSLSAGGTLTTTMETGSTDRDVDVTTLSMASTASGTYTVVEGDASSDLTAASVTKQGTITDAAGNVMSNFDIPDGQNLANSSNIVIETTRPTIQNINSSAADKTYGVGAEIPITVTFTEAVTLSGTSAALTIPLETGDTDVNVSTSTITNSQTATGTYTVLEGHTTSGSNLTVKTDPGLSLTGTIADGASNENNDLAIPAGQNLADSKNIKVDGTYPTIQTSTTSKGDDTYKIGDVIPITLAFSEDLTLTNGTLDIVLNHGNADNATVSIKAFGPADNASINYKVVENDTTNDLGHISISLGAGATLIDGGGNLIQNYDPVVSTLAGTKAIVIDGNSPKIMKIKSSVGAGYYKIDDVIPIQIYFTEIVTASALNILTATLETGASDATVTYVEITDLTIATANYTVRSGDYNSSLTLQSLAILGGQAINDQAGNPITDTEIPPGKNLADEIVDIFVDGVVPVDRGIPISMVSTGNNVVAGKYNDTNTGVDFTVAIQKDDASLVLGTIQMKAKIAPNDWAPIGDPHIINDANKTAGSAVISVASAPIEGLTSFTTDAEIKIKATVTDVAGNATDWAESSNTLTIDVTAPTITSVSSITNAGVYKATDNINVTLGFSEAVTMHNDVLDIILNTSATIELASGEISNVTEKSATYTVAVGETTPDIAEISAATLAVTQVKTTAGELRDQSGNPMVLPVTNIPIKIADAKAISVDGVAPTALTVDKVIATGNTVRHKYWNAVNTGVEIKVPLTDTDKTLIDGQVRIKARLSNLGTWVYIGDWSPITSVELTAKVKVMTLTKNDIAAYTDVEANIIEFTAGVQDKAGNETEWKKSTETLIVDTTPPAIQQVTATITAVGGNVVTDYWNSTNTSLTVKVDFPVDATLVTGEVLLTASEDGVNYTDFRDTTAITAAIYAAQTVTVSVDDTIAGAVIGFEELPWFSETDQIEFRAKVLDRAGNETHYTVSTTKITVKAIPPTVTMVTSPNDNKAYKAGETLTIQVVGSEVLNVTGTPQITLETGDSDAVISYNSGTTTATLNFSYPIIFPHTSLDLNYFDIASLDLNAGTILDNFGNPLTLTLPALDNENSLGEKRNLVIDTKLPSVRFTYDDPDSLVRLEDATLLITATFSDDMTQATLPQISVDYPGLAAADLLNQNMLRISDKVYTYEAALVDNSDGLINVTVSASDKALNAIAIPDSIFDGTTDNINSPAIVTIDNTDPIAFATGLATLIGDTLAGSWFNDSMDSLKIIVPIDVNDNSLLRGNIQIQMHVDGKMVADTWATILQKDTLQVLATNVSKYRTRKEIIDILTPQKLAQGDSVFIRALINDQVGNTTIGTQSKSFFQLDTLPPTIPNNLRGFVLTDDVQVTDTTILNRSGERIFLTSLRRKIGGDLTKVETIRLWTNDSINFATQNWEDPKEDAEVDVSGIARYQYALYESANDNENSAFSLFRSYKTQSDSLDTVFVHVDSLRHKRWYYPIVQAVDSAGNTSNTLEEYGGNEKLKVFRHNARPVVDAIADTTTYEDKLWEQLVTVNDKDLSTLLSDVFSYELTTMKLDTTETPIDSAVVTSLSADVTQSGKVSFTPTKLDTADYVFRVIVTDNWDLKDTVDIDITAVAVNDPPVIDLAAIKKLTFFEGTNSDSINLTRFVSDEDNFTKDLKYSFRIASKITENIGYPTAKFGFLSDFSTDFKKSFINNLIDEFPTSTIVQKNNSFIIYPANETNFLDPIKVDSLAIGDSVKAWITQTNKSSGDTNYYTNADMIVEFTVTDPGNLSGNDTVTFFINPINDPPVWSGVPDTIILENDSLYFDFANYLTDVDDSTLTISILPLTYGDNISIVPTKTYETKPTGIEYATNAHVDTVKFKPEVLWFGPNGPWVKNKTDSTLIQITAADGDTSAIDTFVVKVQRVPRPEIRMYVVQNNAFTNYYEIFLVDSVGKTKDLTLKVQSKDVTLDTAAAFTYVGHYNFRTKGTYTFEVAANGIVGDTIITQNVGLALAKMYGRWSGRSADGQFNVIGRNGAVDFDQSIMIMDSTLFEPYFNDRASYLLGNEAFRFKKSVEISMPGQDDEVALYQRSTGTGWIELPSITQGNRVIAYTEKMGYFRMGPKTLIVPGQTALQQNYPNPFNPITTIEYDLGFVDGPLQKVSLTVYDILGRNVRTLVNKHQGIGRYRLRWNGKDQNGVSVASGIYFVHLLTDMGRSHTKKIMLMR